MNLFSDLNEQLTRAADEAERLAVALSDALILSELLYGAGRDQQLKRGRKNRRKAQGA